MNAAGLTEAEAARLLSSPIVWLRSVSVIR